MQFPDRISVRLDDDVRALCDASAAAVDWANQAHLVNAALRRALLPWKPKELTVRVDPFEQLVFFRRLTCKRTPKK